MLKKALILVSIVAILLALGFTYVFARFRDKAAIERAQLELQQLRGQRDSLTRFVAVRDSLQQGLELSSDSLITRIDFLRRQVRDLEADRRGQQLSVRQLRRPKDLQDRLRTTYPEMAASDWGVTDVMNEEQAVEIQYLLVPLWFSETFIIDHQNSVNYASQVGRLNTMDSLHQQTITLKDQILVLEREKTEAFRTGYDSAYTKYEALNQDYIKLLKNPRVSLKWTGPAALLGSAAAGVLVGVAVSK
jgi:hypothetical protein